MVFRYMQVNLRCSSWGFSEKHSECKRAGESHEEIAWVWIGSRGGDCCCCDFCRETGLSRCRRRRVCESSESRGIIYEHVHLDACSIRGFDESKLNNQAVVGLHCDCNFWKIEDLTEIILEVKRHELQVLGVGRISKADLGNENIVNNVDVIRSNTSAGIIATDSLNGVEISDDDAFLIILTSFSFLRSHIESECLHLISIGVDGQIPFMGSLHVTINSYF